MEKENYKKTILIDLDGVLNEYKGDFNKNFIPPIKRGAKNFIKKLSQNFEIKIFTTRNRLLTAKWLIENNLDSLVCDITNVKDIAYLYIDDRCLKFDGSFKKLATEIETFKPHWQNVLK